MRKTASGIILLFACILLASSATRRADHAAYISAYRGNLTGFRESLRGLLEIIRTNSLSGNSRTILLEKVRQTRLELKKVDFYLRYLDPVIYKKINGPLPIEWETEVFEKYEAPYKRQGAGLTLAEKYLDEKNILKDSLEALIETSVDASGTFLQDSITRNLNTHQHFFLANRLFLLNLASIYTTGFECPDTTNIIPELRHMLLSVKDLYSSFESDFPSYRLSQDYKELYKKTILFVEQQPINYSNFDHFSFIRNFIDPLYRMNHRMILDYGVRSSSYTDYALNKYAASIFDKSLYKGQNEKGVFIGITDESKLEELKEIGKMLFYDPILSGNNKRSCASCHKPGEFFTDTATATSLQFNSNSLISRNTPSLLNVTHHHLLMLDGKHINLENQARDVITNPLEMGSTENEVIKKIMNCNTYKTVFKKYLAETPQYSSVNMEHIASALIIFYSQFSNYYSPFDEAMSKGKVVDASVKNGFNLFMSKAQCGTCHFVPQFNGTKPPYTSSEFEVLGVPSDTSFRRLSEDKGRSIVNPAREMEAAFRTATVRNSAVTKPYMHNGVFPTLESVLDFYDAGGGSGKGLEVANQTLSRDSLRLSSDEKKDIIYFIRSLNENIPAQLPPGRLPDSKNKDLNNRKPGGEY